MERGFCSTHHPVQSVIVIIFRYVTTFHGDSISDATGSFANNATSSSFLQNTWKPQNPSEGEANIETKRVNSKGTVSAAGLTVDTSNRVVKQVFDIEKSCVYNEVELDFGVGRAGGTFRESPNVPNRALVSFNEASITFNNGFVLDLGWVFAIIAVFRKSKDNGWLETTFLDSELRIGRGNKGTMFILTRDRNAVQP
jgi:hypothetical protein